MFGTERIVTIKMKPFYESNTYEEFCAEQKRKGLKRSHWKNLEEMWRKELEHRKNLEECLGFSNHIDDTSNETH